MAELGKRSLTVINGKHRGGRGVTVVVLQITPCEDLLCGCAGDLNADSVGWRSSCVCVPATLMQVTSGEEVLVCQGGWAAHT